MRQTAVLQGGPDRHTLSLGFAEKAGQYGLRFRKLDLIPVRGTNPLPSKPNNTKRVIDLHKIKVIQDSLTESKYLQREDGSRLCFLIASRNMSGKLPDATTGSCSIL